MRERVYEKSIKIVVGSSLNTKLHEILFLVRAFEFTRIRSTYVRYP